MINHLIQSSFQSFVVLSGHLVNETLRAVVISDILSEDLRIAFAASEINVRTDFGMLNVCLETPHKSTSPTLEYTRHFLNITSFPVRLDFIEADDFLAVFAFAGKSKGIEYQLNFRSGFTRSKFLATSFDWTDGTFLLLLDQTDVTEVLIAMFAADGLVCDITA